MKKLLSFSASIDKINHTVGVIVGWLVLITTLVSAYNAVVRKAFNISSNGLLEIQWYLFGAVFLLGAGYTLKQNAHVRIDLLAQRLSIKTQLWIEILGYLFFMLPLVAFVGYHGFDFALKSFQVQEYSPDVGGLIRWPAKAFIVVGFGLLGLQVIAELIKKIAMLRGFLPLQPVTQNTQEAELEQSIQALQSASSSKN